MMTEAEFREWRANPLTVKAMAGLKARQSALAAQWAAGASLAPETQTMAKILGEIPDLDWSDWFPEQSGPETG